jgi:methionyl-tRNA formyltransferase
LHKKYYKCKYGKQINFVYINNENELTNMLNSYSPEYIFFIHWNWIVSKDIISRYNCVCFHMTNLPYGRGGSPCKI